MYILFEYTFSLLFVSKEHRDLLELYSFSVDYERNNTCYGETRSTYYHSVRKLLSPNNNNNHSVALVREPTILTERPPLFAKLVPTFADRGMSRSQRGGSLPP
jgi:uncharacterized protein VirK/YbjX